MSLDNLPVEWSKEQLGFIVNFIDYRGKTPTKTSEGIPLITAKNIRDGYINREPREYIAEDAYDEWMTRGIPNLGDLVITTEAPMGNVAVLNIQEKFALAQRAICLNFKYNQGISKFIYYYLRSQSFKTDLQEKATGTTVQGIKAAELKKIFVPLAPLAEQQEIVRQLDVMLDQVEQIKARLDAIPAILKKFRQSVFADAVSGKLTENANCSKWIKSTIGAEFKCIDGDRGKNYPKKEDYQAEGYCLFLSTKNVRKFGFLFDEKVFISKQKHEQLRNGTLQRDDLIITTRGTLGHIASYDKNVPFDVVRINSGMLILRKTKQNLLNEFMMLLLASPKFQRIIEEQRTGSAQPQLPAKILKEFEIELPSLDEQQIIVKKVESYFKLIEKIENTVQSAQKRVNLLTQSILAKAFSGELTTEWREQHQALITGVNSAESLLANIQAEREVSKPVKKTRVKKEA